MFWDMFWDGTELYIFMLYTKILVNIYRGSTSLLVDACPLIMRNYDVDHWESINWPRCVYVYIMSVSMPFESPKTPKSLL